MSDKNTHAGQYKFLIDKDFGRLAKEYLEKFGQINPDGWIYFPDGSKYNTANNQTINPGDIIVPSN